MQRIIAIVAILAMATGLSSVKAQTCQECQTDNDVYCHNQTAYQNCMKNAPIGDIVLCPTGTVCSNSDDVCVDSSEVSTTILDVCGSSGGNGAQCEVCSSKYACVSSTQYVRCSSSGVPVTSNVYSCGSDEICIIQSLSTFGSLCVPSCASEFVGYNASCSNSVYQPATTTAAPTTTPSATQKEQYCIAAEPTTSYSYFFARNTDDSTCTTYLYCQKSGTDWIALFMTCGSSTPFFDSATGKCVKTKPASCSVTTTTTSTTSPTDSSSTDSSSSEASSTESSSTESSSSEASSTESSSTDASSTESSSTDSSSTESSSTDSSSTESSSTDSSSTESSSTDAPSTDSSSTDATNPTDSS
ncbi:uncharacterized protein [Drosophila takahashii]|uniref:uncharacterized protein isoform X1 n=1 Tax=Drosophila takahashii TaxID=29030 RepID=UPI001CF84EF8|nr:putative protein TPRXL [Drosophila takahashii]